MRGLASSASADFWRQRCATPSDAETFIADYKQSVAAPHRAIILEALARCAPWQRVHELGCHVGPNIARIRERFPDALVTGCDVDPVAVEAAKAWFDDDPHVAIYTADLFDDLNIPYWPTKPDILLTCYTLAYVHPTDLAVLMRRLVQEAQRAIVIAEPMIRGQSVVTYPLVQEWAHDYGALLATAVHEAGRTANAFVLNVPPVDFLNAVLTCVFTEPPA